MKKQQDLVMVEHCEDGYTHIMDPQSPEFWDELKARMGKDVVDYFKNMVSRSDYEEALEELEQAPSEEKYRELQSYLKSHLAIWTELEDQLSEGIYCQLTKRQLWSWARAMETCKPFWFDGPTSDEVQVEWEHGDEWRKDFMWHLEQYDVAYGQKEAAHA